ncbi:MAG: gamma-glutamyl-gamma-aminobutyrate hydrolase family protein [Kiloniellaceae bacterium]
MVRPPLKPLIGVPACVRAIDGHPFHSVRDKYLRAVAEAAGGIPLVIPAFGRQIEPADLVGRLDGLMLTGSPSNVHPTHYGRDPHPEAEPHDPERDATTLPLIHSALDRGLPLFAICRGMQELNVALGGTLHARVHELPGRMDHRRPRHEDPDVQYGPRHPVSLTPGGELERLIGTREIVVNSLHGQGLDRVAETLIVEAVAEDGTIEAVSVKGAHTFALGVQWHPEYKALENPVSTRLFAAFGAAARARAAARAGDPARPARAAE